MKDKYLFLFTIGPVQSFIAEARKTKDLYAGSRLLSDLIELAIEETKRKDNNAEIIFPVEQVESKPNRFIAIVTTENPQDFGKSIEENIKHNFKEIANNLFNNHFNLNKIEKPLNFHKQIEDFLEIFWIMKPYENNYSENYNSIEKEIGTIKNIRSFKQLEETGRKCSLCGRRNSIFYKKTNQNKPPAFIQKDAIEINKNIELSPGEGLCAICFVKRFYNNLSFPSTAKIAALDWTEKIPEEKLEDYKKFFQNFDAQLFYEDNLRKEYLERYNHFKSDNDLKNAKTMLYDLYENYGKPKKYYALVMLDGDNMGKWLSGEFLVNKTKLKDFHIKISKLLGEYSKYIAKNLIPDSQGKLIYAGGDDVLAFLNIDNLFELLKKLREKFPKFEESGFQIKESEKSSASAGIVIAHYKTPLSEALKWARTMEHEAKEKVGRDSFAIAVLKHSGEISKIVYKWENGEYWTIDLLKELIKELKDEQKGFSSTFIKVLQNEFNRMYGIPFDAMLKTEFKRLLKRACLIKNNKELKEEKVNKWREKLFELYLNSRNSDNFFSFLNIADFLSKGGR